MDFLALQTIPVAAISCDRTWSLHRDLAGSPEPELTRSIAQFGIIRPPILRQEPAGSFELVCGAYRFSAAVETLRQEELDCLLVPETMQVSALLQLLLEDQLLSSHLTPIEKARFVMLCRTHLDPAASSALEQRCGLGSRRQLDRCLELLDLDTQARSAIHRGLISEQIGQELLGCEPCDRDFLVTLFVQLGLNRNKQRRLLDSGRVIMALERKRTFMEIFRDHFPDYLDRTDIPNPPQAAHLLLRDMAQLSNPQLSRAEDSFKKQTAELGLPESCNLVHAKSFEQDEVTLQIRFRDLTEFRRTWPTLKDSLGGNESS